MPRGVVAMAAVGLALVLTAAATSSTSGGFPDRLRSQWPLSFLFGTDPQAKLSWKQLATFDISHTTQAVLIFWAAHLLYRLLKHVGRTLFADDDDAAAADAYHAAGENGYAHAKAGADASFHADFDGNDEDLGSATTPSRGDVSLNDSRRPSSFFSSFLSVSSFFTPPSSPCSAPSQGFSELKSEEEYLATKTEHTRTQLLKLRGEWDQLDEGRRRRITHRRYVEQFVCGATDMAELDENDRDTLRTDLHSAMLFDSHALRTFADSPTVCALRFSIGRFLFALGTVAVFTSVRRSHNTAEGAAGTGAGTDGSFYIDWLAQQLRSLSAAMREGHPAVEMTTALILGQIALRLALRFREAAFALVRATGLLDIFNSMLRIVVAGDTRPVLALALNPALLAVACTISGTALGLISQDAVKAWLLFADDSHASPLLPATLLLATALFLSHQLTTSLISHPTRRGMVDATTTSTAPAFSLSAAVVWTIAAHILATLVLSTAYADVPPLFAAHPGFDRASAGAGTQPHMPWLPPIHAGTSNGTGPVPPPLNGERDAPAFDAYDAVSTQYASVVALMWAALTAASWTLPVLGLLLMAVGHTLLHAALVIPLGLSFLVLVSPACFTLARLVLLSWPSAFFLLGISLPISLSTCLAASGLRRALDTMPAFFAIAPTVLLASMLHVCQPIYLSAARVIFAAHANALVLNAHVVPAVVRQSDDRQLLAEACNTVLCRFTSDAADRNARTAEVCRVQAEQAWTLPRFGENDFANAVHLALVFALLSFNGTRLQTVAIALATTITGLILLIPVLPAGIVQSSLPCTTLHITLIAVAVAWQLRVSSRLTRALHLDPTHPFLAPNGAIGAVALFLRNVVYGAALVTAIEHLSPFAPRA